jgi:hypothetical protein
MEKQKQWYNIEDLRSQHFKVHDLLQQRLKLIHVNFTVPLPPLWERGFGVR